MLLLWRGQLVAMVFPFLRWSERRSKHSCRLLTVRIHCLLLLWGEVRARLLLKMQKISWRVNGGIDSDC